MSLIGRKIRSGFIYSCDRENQVEEIFSDFTMVIDLLRSEKDLMNLMLTPSLNLRGKRRAFYQEFFKSISNKYVKNYLMILVDKSRFENIMEIYDAFRAMTNEHNNLVEAHVLTVVPLDEETRASLENKLAKRFNKKVVLEKHY